MLNERQAYILMAVIDEYIRTAEPVASRTIADAYDLQVSSATIRHDMGVLEQVGFLRQPHTSAGRVPTEEGYRFYLTILKRPDKVRSIRKPLKQLALEKKNAQALARDVAKALVQISGETAFARIGDEWSHYTGISKLFEKPDFGDVETLRDISCMIDRFDDIMEGLYKDTKRDMHVWIGQENPFGEKMSTIMVKYELPNGMTGILGLVGPLRMQYKQNMKLLGEARKLLEDK